MLELNWVMYVNREQLKLSCFDWASDMDSFILHMHMHVYRGLSVYYCEKEMVVLTSVCGHLSCIT